MSENKKIDLQKHDTIKLIKMPPDMSIPLKTNGKPIKLLERQYRVLSVDETEVLCKKNKDEVYIFPLDCIELVKKYVPLPKMKINISRTNPPVQQMTVRQRSIFSKLIEWGYLAEKTSFEEDYDTEVGDCMTIEQIDNQITWCEQNGATDHIFYWYLLGMKVLTEEDIKEVMINKVSKADNFVDLEQP